MLYRSKLVPGLAVGLLLGIATGCRPKATPSAAQPRFDGHDHMVQVLKEIDAAKPYDRMFFEETIPELESALVSHHVVSPTPKNYLNLTKLARQNLFQGNNQEALDQFTTAFDLLPKVGAVFTRDTWEEHVFHLAMANMRLAETTNCVHCRTGESCLLPITPGGIHKNQTYSRNAIKYLTLLLSKNPKHYAARWLLNVAYMTVGEYPDSVPEEFLVPPDAFNSEEEFPKFPNVAADVGLDTVSLSGGAIVDDFDGDHDLDVMVSSWGTGDPLRYYVNNADGTFTEQTEQAGLTGLTGGLNLNQADYDNDGDLDVFVMRGAWMAESGLIPNSLLRNDGHGRFRDVSYEAGIAGNDFPTQASGWADFDNDGDLDLYVGNEKFPSQLFRNEGNGTFVDIAAEAGVLNDNYVKGVTWGDYDNDRYPDLYVSNLGGANRLYHNEGNGTFRDVAVELNVTGPQQSFPTWFWDFNNDGQLDLYVSSYPFGVEYTAADYLELDPRVEADKLYQGSADGTFQDVAAAKNLHRVTQPMGSNFGDLDNDGYLDFYLGTGYPAYEALMPNLMFHNHQGERFTDVTTSAGFGHLQKGHGIAFADIDQDGDQDVFEEMGGAYPGDLFANVLFENPGFDNHWVAIRLIGETSNRCAIGARIKATIQEGDATRDVYKWVNSGGSFGANPLLQTVGLGKAEQIQSLEIYWPTSDTTQTFENVAVDQWLEIHEGESKFTALDRPAFSFPEPTVEPASTEVATP